MNPDISVNVCYENRNPFPLYNSPRRNCKYHANLLLVMDEKNGNFITFSFRIYRILLVTIPTISIPHIFALTLSTVLVRKIIWGLTYQNAVFILLSVWNTHHLNMTAIQNTTSWSLKLLPVPMVLYCDIETFLVLVEENDNSSKTTKELDKPCGFHVCALLKILGTPNIFVHKADQMYCMFS